jgi:hypothetical protein
MNTFYRVSFIKSKSQKKSYVLHVLTLNGHLYWLIFFNFERDGCSKLFSERKKVNSLLIFSASSWNCFWDGG